MKELKRLRKICDAPIKGPVLPKYLNVGVKQVWVPAPDKSEVVFNKAARIALPALLEFAEDIADASSHGYYQCGDDWGEFVRNAVDELKAALQEKQ